MKLPSFIKKKSFLVTTSVIIVGLIIFACARAGNQGPQYETVVAEYHDLAQTVGLTGRVEPTTEVDLNFETSGRIRFVAVQVGDRVTIGRVLVSLDASDLVSQRNRALAAVQSAEARLEQLRAALSAEEAELLELEQGTRPESLAITQAELEQSEQTLENLYLSVHDVLSDSYAKAVDAINYRTQELFIDDTSNDPKLGFTIGSSQLKSKVEDDRYTAGLTLTDFQALISSLSTNNRTALDAGIIEAKTYLAFFSQFLNDLTSAVNTAAGLDNATIASHQANVASGLASISTAMTNLSNTQQSISAQQSAVATAKLELTLASAGARPEVLAAQQASVSQAKANINAQLAAIKEAQASVGSINAQLAKTSIVAPINGVVTKQNAKVGEIVSVSATGEPIVSLISDAQFKITTNVPEADIAKIHIGDDTDVTLDAYGNEVHFPAKVISVDPAETIIEGVPTYKVTLEFVDTDERIRSGMTANMEIMTDQRTHVIAVPQRAIQSTNGEKTAQILNGELPETVAVTTGLVGADGLVEILSGIDEGDIVIAFTKE